MGAKDQRAPFRYVLAWKKAGEESITMQARYQNFLKGRGKEEVLELGRVEGTRCFMMKELVKNVERRYKGNSGDGFVEIDLPPGPAGEDLGRRIALLASVLQEAPETATLQRAYDYLDSATALEINFWASKMFDREVGPEAVVPAILLVSRAMMVRPAENH
jgi:hypothetical protein